MSTRMENEKQREAELESAEDLQGRDSPRVKVLLEKLRHYRDLSTQQNAKIVDLTERLAKVEQEKESQVRKNGQLKTLGEKMCADSNEHWEVHWNMREKNMVAKEEALHKKYQQQVAQLRAENEALCRHHGNANPSHYDPYPISPDNTPSSLPTRNTTQRTPGLQKPTRHPNTHRKNQDWTLKVKHACLMLGDSNLSHMPAHGHKDVQIDSYPGAKFSHVTHLLEKTERNRKVDTVILSFGINNRDKPKEATLKQIQQAKRAATQAFPEATIYVPCVNYSHALPTYQRRNLDELNYYIRRDKNHIPSLPDGHFQTTADQIHWTSGTAAKMLEHWLNYLN